MGTKIESEPDHRFRPDIEGLRAVAVLLVLAWHAKLPLFGGGFVGVDVFFVISGFLITRLLLSEVAQTGRVSLLRFYARRARRLLPATAVVLTTVLLLSVLFLPDVRWEDTAWDVIASALYVVNWRLADRSIDYLASDQAPSVVQHFWSLAVEEQFYLLWPLLIIVVALGQRRLGWSSSDNARIVALLAVAVPSLLWSIYLTFAEPGRAYFVTTTRLWELAIGALLAVTIARFAYLPRRIATILGWAGLGAIGLSAVAFSTGTAFPGFAALLPTLGAAAVIAAGAADATAGPAPLLSTGPMRLIGTLSYSLYLWHWPLLVLAEAQFGRLGPLVSLLIVVFSFLPALLTFLFVEDPVRRSAVLSGLPRHALGVGALCMMLPLVVAAPLLSPKPPAVALFAQPDGSLLGAAGAQILGPEPKDHPIGTPVDSIDWFTPEAVNARDDVPTVYADGCHAEFSQTKLQICSYGDETAKTTIAVVGDSHAAQWVTPLQALAVKHRWRLISYTKSSCPFLAATVVGRDSRPYTACDEWNKAVQADIVKRKPNLLLITNSDYRLTGGDGKPLADNRSALIAAMKQTARSVADGGVRTVIVRDTPRPNIDVTECVSVHKAQLSQCSVDRAAAMGEIGDLQREAALQSNLPFWDFNDAICPTNRCAAVIGHVLVYRDTNHLTATYARSLAPRLEERIKALLATG